MLEIQRVLAARGAVVRTATHGGTFERMLRDAGVTYDLLGPGVSVDRCAEFVRSVPGIGPPQQSMWSDDEIRAYVAEEAAYFREHGVRVAVTGWTLTALLSTRVAGIPLVTEHAGSFIPPVFERGLLPAPTQPIGLPYEKWLPTWLRRRLFNSGAERFKGYIAGFNRVAAELGVEAVPSFAALLLGDLTLVTDVPELLGVPSGELESWTPRTPAAYRPGTRFRYSGPLYAKLPVRVPGRVERFLAGARPIVYVAITSAPEALLRPAVEALRTLDVRILVAGITHDLSDLEDDRVLVEGVLPSDQIMPRVDLAVTAGGQGSVQTALASGLPFVAVPLQPEQEANVAIAARQGAGRLVRQDAIEASLARTVSRVLGDERYRSNARRLQQAFGRVDGAGEAADAILELLD